MTYGKINEFNSSDEGDTSQGSLLSEEERVDYADAAWTSEGGEPMANSRPYLCVPPPSPIFVTPRSVTLYRNRARRDARRIYLERRRTLVYPCDYILYIIYLFILLIIQKKIVPPTDRNLLLM